MTISDTAIVAGISALAAAVVALWRQNSQMGVRLDVTNRKLGRLEGFVQAVRMCTVGGCLFKDFQFEDPDITEFSDPK